MRNVGFNSIKPEIARISFRKAGAITLHLEDGRSIIAPLNQFPGIAQLSPAQRRHYHIADGDIILFHNDDEVYHIQDFLGTYETNAYQSPVKQQDKQVNKLTGNTIQVGEEVYTIKNSAKRASQYSEQLREATDGSNLHK